MANRELARAKNALRLGKLGRSRLARAVALGILIGGASAVPTAARAANSVWTGTVSDDWSNTANWVVPPVSGSFVLIDALAPHDTHLRSAADTGAMIVGDQAEGRLVVEAGGQLQVLGSQPAADPYGTPLGLVIANAPGSQGTVQVDGAGAYLAAENNTLVGNGGIGNLSVLDGGTAELGLDTAYAETIVGFGYYAWGDSREGVGHVIVDGAGSALNYAGGINVLNGTVDVSNGGHLASLARAVDGSTFWVDMIGFGLPAAGDGSFGELVGTSVVTVSGAGSAWNSVNGVNLGSGGDGTLAVRDGGAASFEGFAVLGDRATLYAPDGHSTGLTRSGTGSLLVSGLGSTFTLTADPVGGMGYLQIGNRGAGSARIEAGGSAAIAGTVTVGGGSDGTLDIDTGGTMTVGGSDANGIGFTVGNSAGTTGVVTISGAGSTLTVDAGAQIGFAGTGSLSVVDGGHASIGLTQAYSETLVGYGFYGWGADAGEGSGSITVDGAGSTLEYAGGLNILNGSVSVSNGGQLAGIDRASDNGFWSDTIAFGVPANPDPAYGFAGLYGFGEVVISGEGSAWNSANALNIGYGGAGVLQVVDGADATFTGFINLGMNSYLYDSPTGSPVPGVAPQAGSGYLVVSGAGSTFSLAVVPGAPSGGLGVLRAGMEGDGGMMVGDGGAATIAGGVEVGGLGTLVIGGYDGETEAALAAGTLDTPTIALLDPSSTLILHHSSTDATLGAAISGTGYIDASSGTTRFTGDSSAFAGTTNIDGGATLAVSGKLGGGMPYVGSDGAGTLLVDGGGNVHVTSGGPHGNGMTLGLHDGSSGTVIVSGAGSTLTVRAGTQIGNAGAGALSVLAGGTANLGLEKAYRETIMGLGYYGWDAESGHGRGTMTVDGAGSTVNYGGGLNVLAGDVTVSNGGQLEGAVRDADADIAWLDMIGWGVPGDPDPAHEFNGLRGVSSVTVTGEGSTWNSLNGLDVGDGGDGSLSVLAGADAAFRGNVHLGGQSYLYDSPDGSRVPGLAPQTGTGKVRVSGAGSSLTIAAGLGGKGWIDVGYHGEGSMEVSNGATASVAYTLYLGDYADGTLSITGGGTMSVLGANPLGGGNLLGVNPGATGTLLVSGTGSKLTFNGGLQVGNAGTGAMSVLDGGTVDAGLGIAFSETLVGFGNYGWAAGAEHGQGTIVVDGAGSTFNYAGGLNVLNGAVAVSGGGRIVSHAREADGSAFWSDTLGFGLPANPDGSYAGLHGDGSVTLTGAGSAWNSLNGLNIGYGDDGSLAVLDGAHAGFVGYAELGKLSYLYDAPDGGPIPGLPGQAGAGALLVSGAGSSFMLSAIAGNTTWGIGVLELGSEGAGSVVVNNGGALSAAGGIKVGAQGSFTVGGMQGGALAAPGSISTPSIELMGPAASLAFDHNATSYSFAPVIRGNGQIDIAGGFTMLTGDSSAFAGDTTIDLGATLSVNGSLGGDILVDGRLQGTGTVGNVTVNDGGTLAPGNSPGTLHVDGDLVMQTGSIYDAEIDSDTGLADSVAVGGNVTIQSGTVLSVSNLGTAPLSPGMDLQLIQTVGADSTVQGQFDSVVGGSDFLDFGVSYEGGQVQVAVERSETTTFANVAGAGFGGLGTALDALPDDNALTRLVFAQVTTAAAAETVMADMAGTIHADLRRVLLEDSRYPRAAIGDRLRDDDASGGVAWVRLMGGSASADGDGALPGATVDRSGMMAGYDTAVGDSRLGVAIGAGKGNYSTDGKDASADLRDHHVSVYGRSTAGGLRLGYGVAFGSSDVEANRSFDIGSERQHLHSQRDARTTQAFLDAGYRIGGGNSFRYLEPFVNLAHVRVQDDDFTETGSVAALEIEGDTTSATFGTLGLRWNADIGGGDFAGSIGWRHAFGLDHASTSQAFVAGGPAFAIDSLPVDDAVLVELGVNFRMSPRARVWFGYDGMFAGSAQDNGLKLQFNVDL